MTNLKLVVLLLVFILTGSQPGFTQPGKSTVIRQAAKFDPARDAAQDIQSAIQEARRTHRRILLDVGGEWCVWCRRTDSFFAENPALQELRDKNFIWVKINFSEENKNEKVLSKYPKVAGYPHLFVLDEHGKLLHSQNTGDLESGKSYDLAKYSAFLQTWAPRRK
ncbi:MAG: thioredoxin family protein [Blastocatellia bacterium]|nr:thioredoxin family protein [Blastocatellia bacterium]